MLPNVEYIKTLVNGLKEFVNSKIKLVRKDIDSLPQADWNQNDPTAKDYIKNRTHYTEIVETSSGVGANGFLTGYMNAIDSPSTFSKVTISGNTYRDIGVVPNGRYLTASVGNYALSFDQMYNNLSVSPSDANANDFEFFIKKEETHTIPDEYIPDWVMNKADAAQPDWNKYYETDEGRVKNRPNIYMESGALENTTIDGGSPSITPAAIFIFYGDFTGKIRTRRISMLYNGEELTRDIVNPYTGNAITDDDCPAGAMIVRCNFDLAREPIFRCVNPVIKDYFTSTDALPQHEMSAAPTEDMQIATKKYVDDAASDFVIKATMGSGNAITLDKTFEQIQEAINDGKKVLVDMAQGSDHALLPLIGNTPDRVLFASIGPGSMFPTVASVMASGNHVYLNIMEMLTLDPNGTMPQVPMASAPTEDMQIATKKYVDDKEFILQSTTPNSTKKFKITVDDSGTITTMEV